MATPDVRIRLSAEGVAEVVNALKKIQAESGRAAGGATRSFGGLNTALGGARTLLTQLGAVIGVGALAVLAKQGADAADQIGKMSQRVGASVENLSALRLAAGTADVTLDQLSSVFRVLNTNIRELQAGSKEQVETFKALGLSAKDFAGRDSAQRLELVARALGRMQDSGDKSALAVKALGRNAQQAIPLLNDLSQNGLAGARREADLLGITLTEQTARAAQSVNDDFTRLQLQLQSGFAKFIEGFAPQVQGTMKSIQQVLGSNADVWAFWGEFVGGVVKGVGFVLVSVFDSAATALRQLAAVAGGTFSAIDKAVRGNFKGAADDIGAIFEILAFEEGKFNARQAKRADLLRATPGLPELRAGAQDIDAPEARAKADDQDRTKRERERLELAKQRAREANARRLFEQGVLAIEREQEEVERRLLEIDKQVAAGNLTQREGFERQQELLRERKAILEGIVRANVAILVFNPFDPEAAGALQAANEELTQVNEQLAATPDLLQNIRTTAKDAFEGAIVDALTRSIAEGEKFLDVMRNIALAIVQAVQQLLAFEIAKRIVASIPGFSGGGAAEGRAAGGLIAGPGTGTSDSIPARLSAGEYVVRAAVVGEPGMLQHLESLNRGISAARPFSGMRRYAEGGLVQAGAGGRQDSSLTVALAPGLVVSELSTPEGERAVVRVVSKHRRATGRALGA